MNLFELFVKIGADTSQAEKGMKNTQKNSETLTNKIKVMSAQFETAQKKVEKLTQEFNESVKKTGATSKETQELAKKLDDAEKEAEQAKKALDGYNSEVEETGEKTEKASGGLSKFASKLGKGLATAAKIGTAAVGAAAAGITALTTQAVKSFAEYEQLAGGAQKIFDQMDYSKIATDANNAYKELGLSANQYLAVINDVGATFAATMGDEAGYEAAKTGLKAISDYASGTGKNVDELSQKFTLITRSTSSYQSIADQFSGILPATSAGFLEQAQAAGILSDKYKQLTEVPIDEYQAAVSKMLEQGVANLGLANNTMNEAFSTLSGSLSMAKGAWSNLVTGLADDSADLDMLIGNFVESVGAVATQLIPKIGTALNGASKLVRDLIPVIVQEIPALIEENLPILAEAAISIVQSLVDGISENQEMLMTTAMETITYLAESLITMLPQIVQLGLDLIVSLANGITASLPTLLPTIVDVILQIVDTLTSPEQLTTILNAALTLITELSYGLMDAIPQLVDACLTIIENLVDFLIDPTNIGMILKAALDIIIALGTGIINSIPRLIEYWKKVPKSIVENFEETNWSELGKNIIDGILGGLKRSWESLDKWVSDAWNNLVGGIGDFFGGIFGGDSASFSIDGSHRNGLDYVPYDGYIAELHKGERVLTASEASGYGGTSIGNITINIDGAKYSDEQSLASAIAFEIQNMTDRRAAVYA